MPRTKQRSFLLILFFAILSLNAVNSQETYGGNCKNTDSKQSPINIVPPFTFTVFNGEFQFNTLFEGFLENNNNTLRLEGDFGSIIYGPKVFNTYEINFKSPSEHTIGEDNVTLPLEIQISSISEDNSRVSIAILFAKDEEDSSFLYTMGFGKGLLQHLKPDQFLEFKGSFSLKEIVPNENKFFMYQGSTTSTPCDPAVWLIAYNTFRISQRQIDDFPKTLLYKRRPVQDLKHRELFITFYPGLEKRSETGTQNNTNNTNATANSSKNDSKKNENNSKITFSNENDKLLDGDEETASKIQNKDSFKILGDTTVYDFDFYGGESAIKNRGIKYIRNEDYLVVYDKEYVKEQDSSTVRIDDKVVDEIIDSLENKKDKNLKIEDNAVNEIISSLNKTKCTKKNLGSNQENNLTNSSQQSNNTTNGSNDSMAQTNNLANFFENDGIYDLWTVSKISKNMELPSDVQKEETSGEFTFGRPEKNRLFVNLNRPVSFLQVEFQPEVQSSSNPFFVITEDMIKNSQNAPIVIDAGLLQNLIASSSNSSIGKNSQNINHQVLKEDTKKQKDVNASNRNDVTSFVQTKLYGLVKERLTDDNCDDECYKLKKTKSLGGIASSSTNQKISFDGYVPADDDDSSVDNVIQNGIKIEKAALDNKTPEEIEELKQKMQRMLDIINQKLDDSEKNVDSVQDESETYSISKEKIDRKLHKTEEIVRSMKDSESSENQEIINKLKEAALKSSISEKSSSSKTDSDSNSCVGCENDKATSNLDNKETRNSESSNEQHLEKEEEETTSKNSNEDSESSNVKEKKTNSKKEDEESNSKTSKEQNSDETEAKTSLASDSDYTKLENEKDFSDDSSTSSDNNNNDISTILDGPNEESPKRKLNKMVENAKKVIDFPGQGKVAMDKSGKWDGISTFNVSSWPDKCKFGPYQSPIHIGLTETFFVEPHMVSVDYGKPDNGKIQIFNDGLKISIKGNFGTIKYGDHEIPVKEVYIHHPSEHTFGEDSSRTDFEIQILHEDQAGARLMVAVFLHNMGEEEESNEFLEDLDFEKENQDTWLDYYEKKTVNNPKIDLSKLVGAIPHFITYDGSLTTPPCTEGVKWVILRKRKQVTKKQIKAFQALFGKATNVRGVQELGTRKLKIY